MEIGNQPTKILYGIDSLVRGGTELQLVGLISRLDKSKFKPYLLTIKDTDTSLIPEGCIHVNLHIPKIFSFAGVGQILKLAFWLRRERIDIVQSYFQDTTLILGIAAWLASVRTRISCFRDMGFWADGKVEKALKKIYPLMTNYIANASAVGEVFVKQFNLKPEKLLVLPNGIDLEKFPFKEPTENITNVCIVGNMTRKVKRTDLFIKAAAELVYEYPNITWHVIGDGHLRPELEVLAGKLGLAKTMIFVGRIPDVDQYLEKMQIGVISSDSEGLSNAILEYMLKGVVCVATNVGGTPEIILDNETGCLVKPNNYKEIANKVKFLIENKQEYRKMALNARRLAESKYSWTNSVKMHENYYSQLLSK